MRESGQVILTIPGAAIADAVLGCGTTTGRDTDKAARFHIELAPVEGSAISGFRPTAVWPSCAA